MISIKTILTSQRSYAILVAAAAITAFVFPEYYDGLLLGGSLYPLGMFQRSIIAMMAGVITALMSFALYILFTSIWGGVFDYHRPAPRTSRGKEGGGESHGGALGQTVETAAVASPLVDGWAGESLSVGDDTGASDSGADGGSDGDGSESGGGDHGGGGDFGGGGGGGGWS